MLHNMPLAKVHEEYAHVLDCKEIFKVASKLT